MSKNGADNLNVKITRRQVITYSGRNLQSVTLNESFLKGFLEVVKKRPRSGQFEKFRFPMKDVVSYSEGEGGLEGTAYATVITNVSIKDITGTAVFNVSENWIRIIDENGVTHEVNLVAEAEYSLVESIKTDDNLEKLRVKRPKIIPKKVRKPKLDVSGMDF